MSAVKYSLKNDFTVKRYLRKQNFVLQVTLQFNSIFNKRHSISACSNNNPNSHLPLWAIDIGKTPSVGYSDKKEIPLSCSICDCNWYNFCLDETKCIFEVVVNSKISSLKLLMWLITD